VHAFLSYLRALYAEHPEEWERGQNEFCRVLIASIDFKVEAHTAAFV
jgi:hypothetical protein